MCSLKKRSYWSKATFTFILLTISSWDLPFTAIYPYFKGIYLFDNTFTASVPLSIKSIFVMTPIVLSPVGSHFLAIANAWDVERSTLAGITARIIVRGSF